ncbi:portal protein [Acinetobacter phage IMEAB3]|uniref:Putative portal protein n=2 Tax=Lokivirus IMEAB3 TaxID=2560266 RepID=A0A481S1X8_9CAUD|nr:portal protein [Acinetobacter phage IMEAB3]AHI60039.1 putative portal protein [Acinetobacter phage IMEAB3]QBG78698.1 putative portal protein [Acinetobacter phage vB_AbaS_D0]
MTFPNVAFVRPEIANVLPLYTAIRDCISGQDRIKKAGKTYLPQPNPDDTSFENQKRYEAYKNRALFYNVTGRTVNGLVSLVFSKPIDKDIPTILEGVDKDATGEGLSMSQQAHKMLAFAISYARYGVYVDYPTTEGIVTVKDMTDGNIKPTVNLVAPHHVINWRTMEIGSQVVYSKIVIAEIYPFADDGFEIKNSCQFRVYELEGLNIEGGIAKENDKVMAHRVKVSLWREPNPSVWDGVNVPKKKTYRKDDNTEFYLQRADGTYFDRIPFSFGGAENNDSAVDIPVMYDMAAINIAHYRNSADYEEASFVMGQPTIWASGLTENWLNTVLGGKVRLGSLGGVALPEGGQMGILQMQPNTMPFEGMGHKEKQMLQLGAKLVENKTVQRTATEANQDEVTNNSILANIANNVSDVVEWAFRTAAQFVSTDEIEVKYRLNTDFDISKYSPEQRAQVIKEWQGGALTFEEMRSVLRKSGVATEKDEDAKKKIDAERAAEIEALNANTPNDGLNNDQNT